MYAHTQGASPLPTLSELEKVTARIFPLPLMPLMPHFDVCSDVEYRHYPCREERRENSQPVSQNAGNGAGKHAPCTMISCLHKKASVTAASPKHASRADRGRTAHLAGS